MALVSFVYVGAGQYVSFPHACPGPRCALCAWVWNRHTAQVLALEQADA